MSRRLSLALLALTSSVALAQSPQVKADVYDADINPAAQKLELTLQIELGFPLGRRIGTVALDCAAGTRPKVDALKETAMDRFEPDPSATTALLASGAVQAGASAVTVKNRGGDLRFFCRDRLLVTDFSRIAADPAAQGTINGTNQSFDVTQTPFMRSLKIRYPLVRTDSSANLIRASGVSISLVSNGGFKGTKKALEGFSFDSVASGPTEAVFLLDDQKRQLLPLKFAGNDSGARTTVGRPVGPTLVLYYAPDYGSPTGWQQTTVDFTSSLIWTQPVPRPGLPISK